MTKRSCSAAWVCPIDCARSASHFAHGSAPGRAILATLPDAEIREYCQTCRGLDCKLRSAELFREIAAIRAQGFASSPGEIRHSGHSLAVAIPSADGRANAALHVSIPRGRYTMELQQRCIDALRGGLSVITAGRRGNQGRARR